MPDGAPLTTPEPGAEWSNSSLKEHMERALNESRAFFTEVQRLSDLRHDAYHAEKEKAVDAALEAQEKALAAALAAVKDGTASALASAEKAVAAALAAQERANTLAAHNDEKWMDKQNEWRGAMDDLISRFMSRSETTGKLDDITRRIGDLEKSRDQHSGQRNAGVTTREIAGLLFLGLAIVVSVLVAVLL